MTETRSRLTKKDKQAITAHAVAATLADYFAGVTKAEAEEVFNAKRNGAIIMSPDGLYSAVVRSMLLCLSDHLSSMKLSFQ